jgi:hypothetical protein
MHWKTAKIGQETGNNNIKPVLAIQSKSPVRNHLQTASIPTSACPPKVGEQCPESEPREKRRNGGNAPKKRGKTL